MKSSVSSCAEYEVLLSLHAAGALERDEASGVEAHLDGCPACRDEVEATRAALVLAALPPAGDSERRIAQALPARTLAAYHRLERRHGFVARAGAGIAVAAAVVAVLLAPAVLRRPGPTLELAGPPPSPAAAPRWEQPDLDRIWDASAVVDVASTSAADGETDAALSALDAGTGL